MVVLKAIYSLIRKVLWVLKRNLCLLNEGERAPSYPTTYTVRGRSEPQPLAVVSHNISDPESGFEILDGKETKYPGCQGPKGQSSTRQKIKKGVFDLNKLSSPAALLPAGGCAAVCTGVQKAAASKTSGVIEQGSSDNQL